jgi:hypothetical protein
MSMATPLDPKQVVSFEELLMSQVIHTEALTRLLVKKGLSEQNHLVRAGSDQVNQQILQMNPVKNSHVFGLDRHFWP